MSRQTKINSLLLGSQTVTADPNSLYLNGNPIPGAQVTGISITGSNSLTGKVNFTGIGGLQTILSGNTIIISGGAGASGNTGPTGPMGPAGPAGSNTTGNFVQFAIGSYNFLSGQNDSTFINFGGTFPGLPIVVVGSLNNNSGESILGFHFSGITTSGFFTNLSDTVTGNNYYLHYIATTGTGFITIGGTTGPSGASISGMAEDNGWYNKRDFQQISFRSGGLSSGNINIYTVPSGFRMLNVATRILANQTGINGYASFNSSGKYYRYSSNQTNISTTTSVLFTNQIILEPTEILSVFLSNTGTNVFTDSYLFPNTVPLSMVRRYSLGLGNNIIYNVPTGKKANYYSKPLLITLTQGIIAVANESSLSVNYTGYILPNSYSLPSISSKLTSSAIASGIVGAMAFIGALDSDNSVIIYSDSASAGQYAYILIYEEFA